MLQSTGSSAIQNCNSALLWFILELFEIAQLSSLITVPQIKKNGELKSYPADAWSFTVSVTLGLWWINFLPKEISVC